ncbi:Uma2 family endonuclease [Dyadobacter sandarakinus]|uniref:Uma2 family endonuclease n=1 Tax=Dyadobacter sandarakinus TaxID=2747268 RepID=A0ABX7I8W9_9BACT|nr:Uma2 family endonuclease [Dyadobacter sandarakinus]QRR02340.1 Uma2 family endonuclease [Dyadobacter sandarakinus]
MEAVIDKVLYTPEEYFTYCETHEGQFEFVNGEIFEMSGETITANQIAGNIHFYMRGLLQNGSYLFMQNAVKLRVEEEKVFRIPDFFIAKKSGNQHKFATEPLLIVEVVSESSAKMDKTTKLNEYRTIQSLQYYLIVEQETCLVEAYIREGNRWYVEFYDQIDQVILLPYFKAELPVSKIYADVDF